MRIRVPLVRFLDFHLQSVELASNLTAAEQAIVQASQAVPLEHQVCGLHTY